MACAAIASLMTDGHRHTSRLTVTPVLVQAVVGVEVTIVVHRVLDEFADRGLGEREVGEEVAELQRVLRVLQAQPVLLDLVLGKVHL